jgi:hypothetical protein
MGHKAMIVLVAAGASLLAACGGSDSKTDTLSRSEIVAKADAICKAGAAAVNAVAVPSDISDAEQAAAYFEKVAPVNQKQTDDLEALTPDDKVKADYDALVAKQRESNDLLIVLRDKAKAKDASGLQDLKKLTDIGAKFDAAATKLGAKTCAEDPSASGSDGKISVVYDEPADDTAALAKQILQVGGTDGVADGFTKSFKLPFDITIHAVNEFVGPAYDPSDKTITLSYKFVDFTAGVLKKNFPELRKDDEEFGRQIAAVDGFILVHEFGHAFVDAFDLPVLGKEEDAADAVATVFLTRAVDNGNEYAFDAARFFNALSGRQRKLAPQDYFDEHSLDKQRAYSIVCWIAGSSEDAYNSVAKLRILSEERQRRCPAEYQQKVKAVESLLKPHTRS